MILAVIVELGFNQGGVLAIVSAFLAAILFAVGRWLSADIGAFSNLAEAWEFQDLAQTIGRRPGGNADAHEEFNSIRWGWSIEDEETVRLLAARVVKLRMTAWNVAEILAAAAVVVLSWNPLVIVVASWFAVFPITWLLVPRIALPWNRVIA